MEYSPGVREVVAALKAVRESDEGIWWFRGMLAVADLFPSTAIAHALHRPDVWTREKRQQLRRDSSPSSRSGFYLEDLITAAETAAAAEGSLTVREVHLARAMSQWAGDLQPLGIAGAAMVFRTQEREDGQSPRPESRPRIMGTARIRVLEGILTRRDVLEVLEVEERSGTVERKRSMLNSEKASLDDQEQAAVALVNGSPDIPVYLIFGQEDDLSLIGEVDHRGEALDPNAIRNCQRRLDQRLQNCVPPVTLKWRDAVRATKRVWIGCMLGRARGTAVRTSKGAYPYRSGEDTYFAPPELITAWQREPAGEDMQPGPNAVEVKNPKGTSTEPEAVSESAGVQQRQALATLREAVDSFFRSPPDIPNAVNGRQLEAWQPVFEPILERFGPAIEQAVAAGTSASDESVVRLSRGLRSIFRLQPQSGLTWIIEAPRLITRIIADRLLVASYCSEAWARLATIGSPEFDSYIGRMPWVLTPEYRHPETLGRHADVAHELSLRELAQHTAPLANRGVSPAKVRTAYAAVTVGLALGTMAREERSSSPSFRPAWALLHDVWDEIETWEEEPGLLDAFASLAGEPTEVFRRELLRRLASIVGAYNSSGFFIHIPSGAKQSIERLAEVAR